MKNRWWLGVLFATLGVGVWFAARNHLSLGALIEQERWLRGAIEEGPWSSFLIGFLIYTLVSLFPGTSGKSVIAGWFYGFWAALAMVAVALTIAAVLGFLLARYLLQRYIRERFSKALAELDKRLENDGVYYLLTVRMLHVPYTLVNYLSGASGVRLKTFAWTTGVGLIPSTMIFVGVGAGLPTLQELADHGALSLIGLPLILALLLMGVAPWVFRWLFREFGPGEPESVTSPNSKELA